MGHKRLCQAITSMFPECPEGSSASLLNGGVHPFYQAQGTYTIHLDDLRWQSYTESSTSSLPGVLIRRGYFLTIGYDAVNLFIGRAYSRKGDVAFKLQGLMLTRNIAMWPREEHQALEATFASFRKNL